MQWCLVKSLTLLVVACCWSLGAHAYIVNASEYQWLEDHPKVKVAVVAERLPLEFSDPQGQAQGYAVDMLAQLASQTHLVFDYHVFSSISSAVLALQQGQVDMLSSAPRHHRLSPFVHYTQATELQTLVAYQNLNHARFSSVEQLSGQKVAVVMGSSAHEIVAKQFPNLSLQPFTRLFDAMQALAQQQVVAIVAGNDEVAAQLRAMPQWHMQQAFQFEQDLEHRFAVRDDWPMLVSLLNRGLNSLEPNFSQQSYHRWQSIVATTQPSNTVSYWWGLGLLLLFIVIGTGFLFIQQKFHRLKYKATLLREQLDYWKNHDEVTGLPNRRHMTRLIADWLDDALPMSVLMFDFPRQNEVFENFGQHLGEVTREAYAKRVQKSLRRHYPEAQLGYWYHHYFVVAIPTVNRDKEVIAIAKQIIQSCRGWLRLEQLQLLTRCHVGYSCFHPSRDAIHSDALLANAFTALNHAVKDGSSICRYHPDFSQASLVKLTLESKLRKAIANDELELFYQPQYCLLSNQVIGAEVLLRWFTDGGAISPDEFVPVAEETGLVLQLDKWVFENAMRFMARYASQLAKDFKLSVNFSAATVSLGHAEKIAISYAQQWQVNPQRICIEITESAMMEQPDEAKASIQRMRDAGFGIAIDDFGTGYSSMAYLKHLPVTLLKIDRAFVSGLEDNLSDQHIVKAMVMVARSMKFQVLIEGIETQNQANIASVMGCEQAQGFFFARPQAEVDFVQHYLPKPHVKEPLRLVGS
ncbi:putative bifunctional diguanylate cyclase/phosphodiesterase [Agarivorans sp. QJM3NY_33]|uniref:putative bifunctional diguanylate cyclase/phosphodiesterase n=1 Tax=Agarivorans sp. QJM3NY_33 TaxID=3421432 RepID=UPI003D7CCA6F